MKSRIILIITSIFVFLTFTNLFSDETIDTFDQSYEGIKRLSVKGEFANVVLEPAKDDKVKVEASLRGPSIMKDGAYIKYDKSGDSLRIWVQIDKPGLFSSPSGTIEITIPESIKSVTVENKEGSIRIKEIESPKISAKTEGGEINIVDIKSSTIVNTSTGKTYIDRYNGDIEINNGTAGDIKVNNSSGKLRISAFSSEIFINEYLGKMDIKTTTGKIYGNNVLLDDDSRFESTSGEIDIQLKNEEEDLSVDLATTFGKIRFKNLVTGGEIKVNKGKIQITGRTLSGSQTYR